LEVTSTFKENRMKQQTRSRPGQRERDRAGAQERGRQPQERDIEQMRRQGGDREYRGSKMDQRR
jgi:hypothetical protein